MPKRIARYFICSIILASRCVSADPIMDGDVLVGTMCDGVTTGTATSWYSGWSSGFCEGYLSGVMDTSYFLPKHNMLPKHCIPSDATYGQIVDVVTKYVRAHPVQRHGSAAGLVLQALATAFPCK